MVAYAGDAHLGGRDFDHVLMEWILDQCHLTQSLKSVEIFMELSRSDDSIKEAAKRLAEWIKIEVVTKGVASFTFMDRDLSLDLSTFEKLTAHLIDRFLPPIREAGRIAMIDWHDQLSPLRDLHSLNRSPLEIQPT